VSTERVDQFYETADGRCIWVRRGHSPVNYVRVTLSGSARGVSRRSGAALDYGESPRTHVVIAIGDITVGPSVEESEPESS